MEAYRNSPDGLSFAYRDFAAIPQEVSGDPLCPIIKQVDLTETNILDLGGLKHFTQLETLILDKNNLESLESCPDILSLKTLWLNNNQIADLPNLMDDIVKKFPNLEYLSVMRNPACSGVSRDPDLESIRLYRMYIIYRMPALKTLDWADVEDEERQVAAIRGQYAAVRQPAQSKIKASATDPVLENKETAIIVGHGSGDQQDPKSSFKGKVAGFTEGAKVKSSRNSEGNRFIGNNQL